MLILSSLKEKLWEHIVLYSYKVQNSLFDL